LQIASKYSHLNGYEWLQIHHPKYWEEIVKVISSVDADALKTKRSREKTMMGRMLFNPKELNAAFREEFSKTGWLDAKRHQYYVTDDEEITREIIGRDIKEQKEILIKNGKPLIRTFNAADFKKGRVSVEVQFGKYSFVQFDLFIKHASDYCTPSAPMELIRVIA
jgi:hypothetical protein